MFDVTKSRDYQDRFNRAKTAWTNAATEEEKLNIQDTWLQQKAAMSEYTRDYNSQFAGAEGPGIAGELRWDQMKYNVPLLESLRRTYGDLPSEELIDKWMTSQRYLNNNLVRLGFTAASVDELDPQKKEDFALQMLTYDNIAATGEGSAPLWEQTRDVTGAILSDPTNLIGLGTFGIGLIPKQGGKALTKELLKKSVIKPTIKRGVAIGATEGAGYAVGYDSFRQSIERDLALQDDWDWGRTAEVATLGAAIGGTLGGWIANNARLAATRLQRLKVENNLENKDVVRLLEEAANDPAKAEELLMRSGYDREMADGMLKRYYEKLDEPKTGEPLELADYAADKVKEESFLQGTLGQAFSSFKTRLNKVGLGQLSQDIDDAIIRREMLQGRYSNVIDKYKKQIDFEDPKLPQRYRNNTPKSEAEAAFFKEHRVANAERVEALHRAGVLDAKQYRMFKGNENYLARVWNTPYLRTVPGAEKLAQLINNKAKQGRDGMAAANDMIESLTGQKNFIKDPRTIVNAGFIRRAMQNKEREVQRSTHVDYARQIKGFTEEELDDFMLPMEARLKLANSDIANRLAFAEKFGANDEKVRSLWSNLGARGMGEESRLVSEAYGIAARKPTTTVDDFGSRALGSRIEQPKLARLAEGINAQQTWKMYLSAIPNLPQAFINSFAALSSMGFTRAALNTFRGPMKALFRDEDILRVINKSGILSELQLQRFITEGMANSRILDMDLKGPLAVLNEPTKFLRFVGFMGVEKMNRMIAASAGIVNAKGLHAKYQRLSSDLNPGKLKQMRINKLRKQLKEIGVKNPDAATLNDDTLAYVANKFNNIVNFTNEYHNIPAAFQGPVGKIFFKFKSFMFNHGRFVKDKVIKPLKKGDPRPAIAYLSTAPVLGGSMLQLRETITGQDFQENADQMEWLVNGFFYAGGAGLWLDMFNVLGKPFESVPYTVSTIAGPAAGDVTRMLGTIAQAPEKDLDETVTNFINTLVPPTKPITKAISY